MAKKHIKTLSNATLKESAAKGGCGELLRLHINEGGCVKIRFDNILTHLPSLVR